MDELAGLSEESRKLALERFRFLQPHLEQGCPLRPLAAEAGIAFRTAQRWVALYAAIARERRYEHVRMIRLLDRAEKLRDPKGNPPGYRSAEADKAENAYHDQTNRATRVERTVPDPTALLIIDEADRLRMAGLEQVRDVFDRGNFGLVLIGMPGMEKRLARFPQFYSRIGFVHEFRPLGAKEIRELLDQHWTPPGVQLPQDQLDPDTAAAIIRITGGNFRLLNRLLAQIERILEINARKEVTKTVVEAARESLVIGQG